MPHLPFLRELIIIVGVGVCITLIMARLRLPTVTGLLLAGALVGPFGFRLVDDAAGLEALAEFGVVLLLFTIGLEFSLSRLRHIARQIMIGGSLQVGLTTAAAVAISLALSIPLPQAVLWGFIFALSSTAIVLSALSDRGELDAPHGRFIVGVLIFQDICVVPMMLLIPVLAGQGSDRPWLQLTTVLGKAALLVTIMILVARVAVPKLFRWVDASRSRELFMLAVVGVCIGTAGLTALVGLSLALGAFVAGMVLADTDYGHRAMGDILPLRHVFTSLFFISLGTLFDARILLDRPLDVVLLLVAFVLAKGFIATIAAIAMRFPARAAWLGGVALAQFGEFGFVLAKMGQAMGLLSADDVKLLLVAGLLSMFLTPIIVRFAPHIAAGEALLRPLARLLGARSIDEATEEEAGLTDHVVVVGYGVGGQLLCGALAQNGVSYVGLELNAETVRRARAEQKPVYYGDITSPEALTHAHVDRARAIVLMINDPQAVRRAISATRCVATQTPILVRSRYLAERAELIALGATDVVCEELEAGMEMMAHVLRLMGFARNVIEHSITDARDATLHSARLQTMPRYQLAQLSELSEMKVESFLVTPETYAASKSAIDLDLRRRTGALLVAIRRGDALLESVDPHQPMQIDDTLYLLGSRRAISMAMALLGHGT